VDGGCKRDKHAQVEAPVGEGQVSKHPSLPTAHMEGGGAMTKLIGSLMSQPLPGGNG